MTYVLPSMTASTQDPIWTTLVPTDAPDAGLFYVRWWGQGSKNPVEFKFESRAAAFKQMDELHRNAPFVRIEMLEAIEWSTRSQSTTTV